MSVSQPPSVIRVFCIHIFFYSFQFVFFFFSCDSWFNEYCVLVREDEKKKNTKAIDKYETYSTYRKVKLYEGDKGMYVEYRVRSA